MISSFLLQLNYKDEMLLFVFDNIGKIFNSKFRLNSLLEVHIDFLESLMGQSCSFAEEKQGNNLCREGLSYYDVKNYKRKLLQSQAKRQQDNLRQVTFLQRSHQIIIQFNDQLHTVTHLPVNIWNQDQQIQDITIEEFLGSETSFICKIKYYYQQYPVWKVFKLFNTASLHSSTIKPFSLFYFSLYQNNTLQPKNQNFIYPQNCSIHTNKSLKNHNQYIFIIQSQFSLSPFVPLRSLGFFMKFNAICWQDNQFLSIIKKCFHLIQLSKSYGVFIFQQWLIDQKGELFPIGTLIQQISEEDYSIYIKQLALYLCEMLYGQKITINSLQQINHMFSQKQKNSKFKHSKSVEVLINLYKKEQIATDKQKNIIQAQNNNNTQPSLNINNYVASYRAKKITFQSTIQLALLYADLGQYEKSKQILYQNLYLLMYEQIGKTTCQEKNQQRDKIQYKGFDSKQIRKLSHKNNAQNQILVQLHTVLSHLISLQRYLCSSSCISQQLSTLLNQYLHLSLILSSHLRSQHNYTTSLQILEQTKQFVNEIDSWELQLHIGFCHYYLGEFQKAQQKLQKSFLIDKNQANLCFLILFYASLLNWQKALQFIQQYQYLINEDYLYDLMISRIFQSKSLTLTKSSNQQEKTKHFYQTIKIVSRLIDRKHIPSLILCQAYEVIADAYFYLKHFATARQLYQKTLALCNSIEYNKHKAQNKNDSYKPVIFRSASSQYARSRSFVLSKSSTIQKNQPQTQLNINLDQQVHQNSISRTRTSVNQQNLLKSSTQQNKIQQESSFIYQFNLLFDFNKKAVLLTSIANCYLMEQNYTQAIKFYQQAEFKVLNHNKDLVNSIKGSLAVCQIQQVKNSEITNQRALKQAKLRLQKITNDMRNQDPSKLQNDMNYIFLFNELNSIWQLI